MRFFYTFNSLERANPDLTPEHGIGIYQYDRTQGPACAIACGAGTIYRNYFAEVNGQIGQSENNQIDCLHDLGLALGNTQGQLWEMNNGYALANEPGLTKIEEQIKAASTAEYEALKDKLRIGMQWDTAVTISDHQQHVNQAYCSALPVAYSGEKRALWESFARLILEATYEATFYAALINYERTGNPLLFLTLVGGGAFGNSTDWIKDAIGHSLHKFAHTPLNIKIVSYSGSDPVVREIISSRYS